MKLELLEKLPLTKIRLKQQELGMSQKATRTTTDNLTNEKTEIEKRLRELRELLRKQGFELQLLELAGNICHFFPGPHPELRERVIAQRVEAARKDILVADAEAAQSMLGELIVTLQQRCPHNLVLGHHDLQDGDYGPITPGHRICAFCGLEETKECYRFETLTDKDGRVFVDVGKCDLDPWRRYIEKGGIEWIIKHHRQFKALTKFLERLPADKKPKKTPAKPKKACPPSKKTCGAKKCKTKKKK